MNRVSSNDVEERLGPNPEAEPPPAHDSLEQMTKDIQDQAATVVSDAFVAKQSKVKNTNPRRSDGTKIEDVYRDVDTINACAIMLTDLGQFLVAIQAHVDDPKKMKSNLVLAAKAVEYAKDTISRKCKSISTSANHTAAKKGSEQARRKLVKQKSIQLKEQQNKRQAHMKKNPKSCLTVFIKQCQDIVTAGSPISRSVPEHSSKGNLPCYYHEGSVQRPMAKLMKKLQSKSGCRGQQMEKWPTLCGTVWATLMEQMFQSFFVLC